MVLSSRALTASLFATTDPPATRAVRSVAMRLVTPTPLPAMPMAICPPAMATEPAMVTALISAVFSAVTATSPPVTSISEFWICARIAAPLRTRSTRLNRSPLP